MKSYWQQKGQYFAFVLRKPRKENQTIVMEVLTKSKHTFGNTVFILRILLKNNSLNRGIRKPNKNQHFLL